MITCILITKSIFKFLRKATVIFFIVAFEMLKITCYLFAAAVQFIIVLAEGLIKLIGCIIRTIAERRREKQKYLSYYSY